MGIRSLVATRSKQLDRMQTLAVGALVIAFLAGACSADAPANGPTCGDSSACAPSPDSSVDSVALQPTAISGVVQKGPFVRGTRVTVQELDIHLAPNGRSYEVETTDDLGAFRVPVNLKSRFVEVIATGYYYNELRDQLSTGTLTLRAVADIASDGTVDVNLLTSISVPLIRDLAVRGQTFADARLQAELAVLNALGFAPHGSSTFDKLDIASAGDENALLLAGSLILEKYAQSLGDSEVAELTQLLSQIGAALSDGGTSAMALSNLRAARCATVGAIDAASVRRNLVAHYASFGVAVSIPPFESFLAPSTSCRDAGSDEPWGDGVTDGGIADVSPDTSQGGDGTSDGGVADVSPDTSQGGDGTSDGGVADVSPDTSQDGGGTGKEDSESDALVDAGDGDATSQATADGNADANEAKDAAPEEKSDAGSDEEAAAGTAKIYWANYGTGTIGRGNLDGTGVNPAFIPGASPSGGLAVDAANIYWLVGNWISRANHDGAGIERFISLSAHYPASGEGLATDIAHVYWTWETTIDGGNVSFIGRANLDGTGIQEDFISGANTAIGVTVDDNHIYWTNLGTGTIGRANLDGTMVDQNFVAVAAGPQFITHDRTHLYWTNLYTESIGTVGVDGSGAIEGLVTGTRGASGIAVDDNYLYWANAYDGTIGRANLDGTGANQSFIVAKQPAGWAGPIGVAIDRPASGSP
jgi:hypothetical protein